MPRLASAVFLTCLLAGAIASPALGTVFFPDYVIEADPPSLAGTGDAESIHLSILVRNDVVLDAVRLAEVTGTPGLKLEPAAPVGNREIPEGYRLEHYRLSGPVSALPSGLGLDLTVDGLRVREAFDLSDPVTTEPRVRVLEDVPRIDPAGFARPLPAPGNETVVAKPGPMSSPRNVHVHGRILFQDDDGILHGVDGATVKIMERGGLFGDNNLGETVTDVNGDVDLNLLMDGTQDIYVRVEAANGDAVNVGTGLFFSTYTRTIDIGPFSGTEIDLLTARWTGNFNEALYVTHAITRARRYCVDAGFPLARVNVRYPDNSQSVSWYSPLGGTEGIHLRSDRAWRTSTIYHEYGHHFVYQAASATTPWYCNGLCEPDVGCGHCYWCEENESVAWSEGFPTWLAWYLKRNHAAEFSWNLPDFWEADPESIKICVDKGTIERGMTTEGIFCSFLIDLVDSFNENDPAIDATSWDRTTFDPAAIFHVATVDRPTTSLTFIRKMREYLESEPGYTSLDVADYWSTVRNNGLAEDEVPPTAPTSVSSPTHLVSVSSPSNMPQLVFYGGTDDFSGVQAHYVTMTPNNPATPDESGVESPGSVITWATPLAPGTWYANVRSVDGAGNRSLDHISYGPMVVGPPQPVDLAPAVNYLWENPLVVRNTPDATPTVAGFPAELLPGNVYVNLFVANLSASGASVDTFRTATHVSGSLVGFLNETGGLITAGQEFIYTNLGPKTVVGGRHRITANIEAGGQVPETDEANNWYGISVVVKPDAIPAGSWLSMPPPPHAEEGNVLAPTTPDNLAGHRFTPTQPFAVVMMQPEEQNYSVNYRLMAYQPSTGPLNGFENPLATATSGYGVAAVVVATSASSSGAFDFGVWGNPGWYDYRIRAENGTTRPLTGVTTLNWTEDEWVSLLQFEFGPADLGYFNFTVTTDFDSLGESQDVELYWLSEADSAKALISNYTAIVGRDGFVTKDVALAGAGKYALALRRRNNLLRRATPATIRVATHQFPLPEVTIPTEDPIWPAAFLPTPSFSQDDTLGFPTELLGEISSTYINFAVRNLGSEWTQPFPISMYIGTEEALNINLNSIPPGGRLEYRHANPLFIRGGRRVLSLVLDPYDSLPELSETNNVYAMQWGWTGTTIYPGQPIVRPHPPDPEAWMGSIPVVYGNNQEPDGEDGAGNPLNFVAPNCDGLRLDPSQAAPGISWHGVAAMPYAQDDIDLRLFQGGVPSAEAFVQSLAGSHTGGSGSEFALINLGAGASGVFDAGIYDNGGGIEDYAVQAAAATALGTVSGSNNFGAYDLAPGMILNLYEVDLVAGSYDFDVVGTNQNVLLGVSVHPPLSPRQTAWHGKDDLQDGILYGTSPAPGGIASVTVPVVPGAEGTWCVAVWKVGVSDFLENAGYDLYGTGVPSAPLCVAIDGTLDPSYGYPLAVQSNPTEFGDSDLGLPGEANGSELDAAYGKIADGNLYLMFTGNLESNLNDLEVFLDVEPGGQNRILGDNAPVADNALKRMGDDGSGNGLTFDLGFEPDVYLTISCGETPVRVLGYGAATPTGGGANENGSFLGATTPASGGILYGLAPNDDNGGVRFTLDNSNTGGVYATVSPYTSPETVTTGIEVMIPLNLIGNPDCVRITAFINGALHDYVSNQFLPPLPAGAANLVEPRDVDLSAIPGQQYFEVCAPGAVGVGDDPVVPVAHRLLHPPAPNPFAGETAIAFTLTERGPVSVSVFDIRGRLVRRLASDRAYAAGTHTLTWDGRDDTGSSTAAGVYHVRFSSGDIAETRRVIFTR